MNRTSNAWMAAAMGVSLAACTGIDTDETTGSEPTAEATADLQGGTSTYNRPEIGTLGFCTATLVAPSYIVTASHCFNYTTGPRNDWFEIRSTAGTVLGYYNVDRSYALGAAGPAGDDIAFAHLTTPVPSYVATPAWFGASPVSNQQVTAWGFGCTSRATRDGGGVKQFIDYTFGNTSVSCWGDSGGPRTLGTHNGSGSIWAVNSGFDGNGVDINANAAYFGPMILNALRGLGGFTITNTGVANFPTWATAAGVKAVAGDFNGDGRGDVALVGGSGWATVPVAFGNGAGGFSVTNYGLASFPTWATAARSAVAGDFNGDGYTDIALLGGSGWNTIPVAFSNGNGTFNVTNLQTPNLPGWAQAPGAYAVAGDFNGDGAADVALVGGQGWGSIPVGFSNRNGTFAQTNFGVANFPGWAQSSGVKLLAGDFDGDGDADIAAVGGSGWRTSAFALSNRNGTFTVGNLPMADFPGWGNAARFALAAQVDGGSGVDIVLTGGSGWATMPVAFFRP